MASELEPHKLALLDQWNALLDEVVRLSTEHLTYGCMKPLGACVGSGAADRIADLQDIEARMLLEIAIVRLARERMAVTS